MQGEPGAHFLSRSLDDVQTVKNLEPTEGRLRSLVIVWAAAHN